jgi:phosphoglycolate phosphatase
MIMATIRTTKWEIRGVNAVLFDKDGTLIDSHRYWGRIIERRARAILKRYSIDPALFPEICLAMGWQADLKRLREEGPIAILSREEVIAILSRFLAGQGIVSSESVLAELFIREHTAFGSELYQYVHILPSVQECIERFRSCSVKIAVVTSDTVVNTYKTLTHLGIDRLFDAVIGADSSKEPKTTGIPARMALDQLGVAPSDSVAIGDAPMDVLMAANGAMKACIGVCTGQISLESLRRHTPYTIASLGELNII